MVINTDEKILYELIKKVVSEVLTERIAEIKLELISYADDNEIDIINTLFDKPSNYSNQEFEKVIL